MVSIWDNMKGVPFPYDVVAKAMSKMVKSKEIKSIWLTDQKKMGVKSNTQICEKGLITWNHFYCEAPGRFVEKKDRNEKISYSTSQTQAFGRSLKELTLNAIETVQDLILENSLYKGAENKKSVKKFMDAKIGYDKAKNKKLFVWDFAAKNKNITGFKNSAIGTLVEDISKGVDIEKAVRSFETKVAPQNYKRSNSIVTKAMIQKARDKVIELNLETALFRRHAVISDLTINNVLFADRSAKKIMNDDPFDTMIKEAPERKTLKKDDKAQNISVEDFFSDIVPKAKAIEVFFEGKHEQNLCSIIAPQYADAPKLFKWDNGFSWSYNGNVTDSIRDKVKKAGGIIDAFLRFSLEWYNTDDLDIHAYEPNGNHIFYRNKGKTHHSSGMLDVDMNVRAESTTPVENIVWKNKNDMLPGKYKIVVHQFTHRNNKDIGFKVEMEYNGMLRHFNYPLEVRQNQTIEVCVFEVDNNKNVKVIDGLESTEKSKTIWNMKTGIYQPVDLVMLSPNFWDDQKIGNKHWFFMLRDCVNEDKSRGFYNEFLSQDLHNHRKVFEHLASKMLVNIEEDPKKQISGLGFSSTIRNEIKCRVQTNNGPRVYIVKF
jgi:hypothetical protein